MQDDLCQIEGCKNKAERLTSTETKYIEVCDECWHKKYKS
jgi:hypothetical protein